MTRNNPTPDAWTAVPQYHFGVYAYVERAGTLLTVRKTRGPYTGLLDLPGGAPEPGETRSEALRREVMEECGAELVTCSGWRQLSLRVRQDSEGTPIDFHHEAAWVAATVTGGSSPRSVDTAGTEWADLRAGRDRLSPLVRAVMARVMAPTR